MIAFFTHDAAFKMTHIKHYQKWLKDLFALYGKHPGKLNFIFCSDSYISEMNQYYLGHEGTTDVITFDYSDGFSKASICADIYIGIETVRRNAIEFGAASFDEELLRVMVHGLLHLFGYKDDTEDEQRYMRTLEDAAIYLY